MAASKKTAPELLPRIRIRLGKEIALGPGKADLLALIDETRSLNRSAKLMGMSYMKAWLLVKIMNLSFRKPLVKSVRGGAQGGGAELTPTGRQVLALYREMNRASLEAMAGPWKEMRRLLKS